MIPDDAILMAYADGELDPIAAKRVERVLAADPTLAAQVAEQLALRGRLTDAFAPVAAEPVPAALTGRLALNVVSLRKPAPVRRRSVVAAVAVAAALVLAIGIGRQAPDTPATVNAELAATLDGQLSGETGPTRVLASFRATDGGYCRVFATPATEGIACRDADGWAIRRTQAAAPAATTAYRQAAAPAAELMAAAQGMMAGDPLDPAAERAARDRGWR